MASYFQDGTEMVGVTVGEADNPKVSVPKAIKGTFFRVVLFYLGSIFLVGVVVPQDVLAEASGVLTSPFVYVYKQGGISFAGHVMNAIVFVAVCSAGNSSVYACSRTLMGLAEEGSAPFIFSKVDNRGVPLAALIASIIPALILLIISIFGVKEIFDLVTAIVG
jgi:lysine-specific permease